MLSKGGEEDEVEEEVVGTEMGIRERGKVLKMEDNLDVLVCNGSGVFCVV